MRSFGGPTPRSAPGPPCLGAATLSTADSAKTGARHLRRAGCVLPRALWPAWRRRQTLRRPMRSCEGRRAPCSLPRPRGQTEAYPSPTHRAHGPRACILIRTIFTVSLHLHSAHIVVVLMTPKPAHIPRRPRQHMCGACSTRQHTRTHALPEARRAVYTSSWQ